MTHKTVNIPPTRPNFAGPFPEPIAQPGSEKRREQDIRMMKSPQYWPHLLLPLKRYRPDSRGEGYGVNMEFGVWDGTSFYSGMTIAFGVPVIEGATPYETTPEALVADGWTVD